MEFEVEVAVRWSDMDAYGHVNHARTVTLIEEARVKLLFTEMSRHGLDQFVGGLLVARLAVDYVAPLVHDGRPVVVRMWVTEVRAASFVLRYSVLRRDGRVVATAQTTMVPYDLAGTRPRRLTHAEREFLARWTIDGDGVVADGAVSA